MSVFLIIMYSSCGEIPIYFRQYIHIIIDLFQKLHVLETLSHDFLVT
jgi:hypothetical protein